MRHIRSDLLNDNQKTDNDNFNFEEKFMHNFDLTKIKKITYNELHKKNLIIYIKRLKTFLFYFFPRFKSLWNNFTKKEKQSIFHSTFWQ